MEEFVGDRGSGDGGGRVDAGQWRWRKVAAAAARGWRRRRRKGGGSRMVSSWPEQGAAVAAATVAAIATAVRLLPRPSLSSHSRWKKLLFFSNDG